MKSFAIFLLLGVASAQGPNFPYSVNLAFNASTNATGYNAYRAPYTTSCGAYTKLNTAPFVSPSYSDLNPPEGSYCYAVTAVDAKGESGLSVPVTNIVIPIAPPIGFNVTVAAGKTSGNVEWAWTNPKGLLIYNELFCRPPNQPNKPLQARWKSNNPDSKAVLTMVPGTHNCVITVADKNGMSGASQEVVAQVR